MEPSEMRYSTIGQPGEDNYLGERLLLQELTHRISNEYASAVATVTLMMTHTIHTNVKLALLEVRNCLINYARVHNGLREPGRRTSIDVLSYLRTLCDAIEQSRLERKGIKLELVGQALQIDSDRCWLLGMIVSELVANSARACCEGAGEIRVEIYKSGEGCNCQVQDNGQTLTNSIRPGRGLRIVGALVRELQGEIEQQIGDQGSTTRLLFPT